MREKERPLNPPEYYCCDCGVELDMGTRCDDCYDHHEDYLERMIDEKRDEQL